MEKVRTIIIDDEEEAREGLKLLFEHRRDSIFEEIKNKSVRCTFSMIKHDNNMKFTRV